jgi:FtsZ-interacting cell division protein YlmF
MKTPTTVITAEQAALAYKKAAKRREERADAYLKDAVDSVSTTKRHGIFWRKTRTTTAKEHEKRVALAEEDANLFVQITLLKAHDYYEMSRSMEALPKDQEVTVAISIAELAF